jgi:hypothetical protein
LLLLKEGFEDLKVFENYFKLDAPCSYKKLKVRLFYFSAIIKNSSYLSIEMSKII